LFLFCFPTPFSPGTCHPKKKRNRKLRLPKPFCVMCCAFRVLMSSPCIYPLPHVYNPPLAQCVHCFSSSPTHLGRKRTTHSRNMCCETVIPLGLRFQSRNRSIFFHHPLQNTSNNKRVSSL
jgi:hypothetical protein